jgi:uncharacterized protein with ATP-grasp and redox domains
VIEGALPPPLRGQEPDSWARYSIVVRLPEIARRTLAENEFSREVASRIEALVGEIPDGRLRPIDDGSAPDAAAWNEWLQPSLRDNWLTAPWFTVETYFYRRLIAITGYFQGDPDPFRHQKEQALDRADRIVQVQPSVAPTGDLLLAALWANQADLSMWPHGAEASGRQAPSPAAERLLVDDREAITSQMAAAADGGRLDIALDNVGAELAADLLLADRALARGAQVRLHAKLHPTFVSDATPIDVRRTLEHWVAQGDSRAGQLAERLRRCLSSGQLLITADPYWTSPLPGWEMPDGLSQDLAGADLLIVKGDANYRRMLGDRHWPPTTPLESVVRYLPAPLGALRALKANVLAGLDQATIARTQAIDPDWMIDGRWGLIQYAPS